VRLGAVVPVPPLERDQERLPHDVLGRRRADPAQAVPVDRRGVPVEEERELVRLGRRSVDDLGVALRTGLLEQGRPTAGARRRIILDESQCAHTGLCPLARFRFITGSNPRADAGPRLEAETGRPP